GSAPPPVRRDAARTPKRSRGPGRTGSPKTPPAPRPVPPPPAPSAARSDRAAGTPRASAAGPRRSRGPSPSSQPYVLHCMVGGLVKDQRRPLPGGKDVLLEVDFVDL